MFTGIHCTGLRCIIYHRTVDLGFPHQLWTEACEWTLPHSLSSMSKTRFSEFPYLTSLEFVACRIALDAYPWGSISELTWSHSVGPRVRRIAMTRAGSFWNNGYSSPSPCYASSRPRGILMKWRRWAWTTSSGRIPRRSVHGLFRLMIQRAPPVCVQLKVWLEAPFLNRWLTPRP